MCIGAAELRNEQFLLQGAALLSYSTDSSMYWSGLPRLLGEPPDPTASPLLETMREEHCAAVDAQRPFRPQNYPTETTAEIEWLFVNEPADGSLTKLGLDAWPGTLPSSEDPSRAVRVPLPWSHFAAHFERIGEQLRAIGEQPLSYEEFVAMRCYTGPLYVKYNSVLRSAGGEPTMVARAAELCDGNRYSATLYVLLAAISRVAKLSPPATVYRAPGGALPASFWRQHSDGCQGGLELGFLSATTNKAEAMRYARRAPGMILLEVQQGFVARGASIAWLSQYPTEDEVLLPPLTALEVVGTRIEGAIVLVEIRPSVVPGRPWVSTGADDLAAAVARREAEVARREADAAQKAREWSANFIAQRAMHAREQHKLLLDGRVEMWREAMQSNLLIHAQRKVATVSARLAEASHAIARERWKRAETVVERDRATELLRVRQGDVDSMYRALKMADQRSKAATARERIAAQQVEQLTQHVQSQRQRLLKTYTSAQCLIARRARVRWSSQLAAQELLSNVMRRNSVAAAEEPPIDETEPAKTSHGTVSSMLPDGLSLVELIGRLRQTIGPPA